MPRAAAEAARFRIAPLTRPRAGLRGSHLRSRVFAAGRCWLFPCSADFPRNRDFPVRRAAGGGSQGSRPARCFGSPAAARSIAGAGTARERPRGGRVGCGDVAGGQLVVTQLSYRGRSAELLAQALPPLRFRFCYCSPSNLCANRVCPAHAVKYASLESSLAPSGCFTGGYGSYVYETREIPRVSELLAVFSLRALHPAWGQRSQQQRSRPLSSLEITEKQTCVCPRGF